MYPCSNSAPKRS